MRRGFTLIEILTAIVIFGILVSITGYVYGKSLERNRDIQRLSDLNNIKNALEQFYLEHKTYPYNTNYASGNEDRPWVAKYELERYKLGDCDSAFGDANKNYLAPIYITTLPEDPRHQITLTGAGSSCQLAVTAGSTSAGYGQYLYVSLAANEATYKRVGQYYLMARMERSDNVSEIFPAIDARYGLTNNRLGSWGQTYCSSQDAAPTASSCSYNFYLKNSLND